MNTSLGLIIGRFQPLHKGHLLLIEKSIEENPYTCILVGSINKNDEHNPYSYALRREIILSEVEKEKIFIGGIPDMPDDTEWIQAIISYIPEDINHVHLYCGDIKNDSAVSSLSALKDSLPFTLQITEIPRSIIPISATQVREYIEKNNTKELEKYLGKNTLTKLMNS